MLALGVVAFVFGAFIGSFLNVCVHRLPRNESIVLPPSRCYACGTRVAWYDNLPIASWLLLRGRCRWCGTGFSSRYLWIETLVGWLTAVVVVAAFAGYLPGAIWLSLLHASEPLTMAVTASAVLVLVWFLVVSALIDYDHTIIPDELTKGMQLVAPYLAALCGVNASVGWAPDSWLFYVGAFNEVRVTPGPFLGKTLGLTGACLVVIVALLPVARRIYGGICGWKDDDHRGYRIGTLWFVATTALAALVLTALVLLAPGPDHTDVQTLVTKRIVTYHGPPPWSGAAGLLAQAILGSLAAWTALYLVGIVGTVAFRRNAMGFGDVKFLAPVGAFLGPTGVLYAFLLATVIGSLVGIPMRLAGRGREIPFGPYLAMGALAELALGPQLHQVLTQVTGLGAAPPAALPW